MKIALCFLLLRYDWQAAPDMPMPLFDTYEDIPKFVNTIQVQMSAREPEIDLSSPKV